MREHEILGHGAYLCAALRDVARNPEWRFVREET